MSLLLENGELRIHLLHPETDRARLGVRYVYGGYIWQVETPAGDKLFSGPRFDQAEPPTFHGQGAPECFRWFELRTERRLNLRDGRGLCPGIGLIEDTRELEPRLLEAAPWTVRTSRNECTMESEAVHQDQGYHLTRSVKLAGKGFTSDTRIRNSGRERLEIHWFPHPFFPHARPSTFHIPGYTLPGDVKGYHLLPDGSIEVTQQALDSRGGVFRLLSGGPSRGVEATLTHPVTGTVVLRADMDCAHVPVWANLHTISPEPHLTRVLEPGESAAWSLNYSFGGGLRAAG